MSEIILSTYNLLDTLDKSDLIKNLKKYKNKLLNNKYILSLVKSYNKEEDISKKIKIKKELYENMDYYNYQKYYQELSLIVLKINHKYKEYTSTKEHHCHE